MADQSLLSKGRLLLLPSLSLALLGGFAVETSEAAMMGAHSHQFAKSYRTLKSRPANKPQITKLNRSASKGTRATAAKKDPHTSKFGKKTAQKAARPAKPAAPKAIPPQLYLEKLNQLTIRPGVVHKFVKGALNVNVVEVDMKKADVKVRPYLASETFDKLKNVEQHAKESGAIVAVNANYFKTDGTPLGAIKVDDEWVSGSLFNRVAMGITRDNDLKFARVNLHGILETSNPKVPRLWVNNMNQPRRTGARLIMYTRRWGNSITLPYEGRLVAVTSKGEVLDTHPRSLQIPYGGYVLTDRKESELAHLKRGDFVDLNWQTDPKNWNQVTHAVSGGPTLIKGGQLYVGLKEEKFKGNWTGANITRRTACGVTADRKLILTTVEGPHTLWDLAKFMQQLGCVEAMNLDGGGSTTMVVAGNTVTRNESPASQRKVATTICVMEPEVAERHERRPNLSYQPSTNLKDFAVGTDVLSQIPMMNGVVQARIQQRQFAEMTMAGDDQGKILGADQGLVPAGVIDEKGIVTNLITTNTSASDTVIDIDNDLYDQPVADHKKLSDKSKPTTTDLPSVKTGKHTKVSPLPSKVENAELTSAAVKAAVHADKAIPIPTNPGWTNKILKPFKFGRRS